MHFYNYKCNNQRLKSIVFIVSTFWLHGSNYNNITIIPQSLWFVCKQGKTLLLINCILI